MKVLIAYDGSHSAESALDDLSRAGLPLDGEALVITVAEVWLPPPDSTEETDEFLEGIVAKYREKGRRLLNHAEIMAKHAATRVRRILPGWTVGQTTTYGSPGWEILAAADNFLPDLIVTGAQGHSGISRLILGSISQKVLTEAASSVRIARGKIEVDPAPCRLIIGFDGSIGASAAVHAVEGRKWPEQSEVKLIAATDSVVPTAIGRFIPSVADWADEENKAEHQWIEHLIEKAATSLRDKGLIVTSQVFEGNPNEVLVREAENWHADCVFVGANAAGGRIERFLLGSTSAAVSARAGCSVEVVRRKKK
ncbi:MAG: universal stress protein [Pyrinomonadaceae bacterium]